MSRVLVRANEDLESNCTCARADARLLVPAPTDAPWRGPGWLFECARCQHVVAFAVGAEVPDSYADLVRMRFGIESTLTAAQVAEYAAMLERDCAGIEVGRRYITFDGLLVPADAGGIQGVGALGYHDLEGVPQVRALEDPDVRAQILASRPYWDMAVERKTQVAVEAPADPMTDPNKPPPDSAATLLARVRPSLLGMLVTSRCKEPVVLLMHRGSGVIPVPVFDQMSTQPWYATAEERAQTVAWFDHWPSSRVHAKALKPLRSPAPAGTCWAVVCGAKVEVVPFKLPE